MNKCFVFIPALFIAIVCACCCRAQSDTYRELIKRAERTYNARHYDSSAHFYSQAFSLEGSSSSDDRYNAACSWGRAGNVDSAFYNLFAIVQLADWRDYGHLMADPDLESLHQYKAWDILRGQVRANMRRHDPATDTALADELEEIHVRDQKYRMRLDDVATQYGSGSAQEKALWDTINKYDAVNLRRITQLLRTRGWLPRSQIGPRGVVTVFLVLQHADGATQDKYMPMMRKAAQTGELPKADFALYEDRVLLWWGKKQIYGSQVQCIRDSSYVLPLEDPCMWTSAEKPWAFSPSRIT